MVRTIRWMHKKLPTKLSKLLASRYQSVWPGVLLIEHNFPIGQSRLLLDNFFFQTVQLFRLQFRIENLVVGDQLKVDDFLPIPLNLSINFLAVNPGSWTVCMDDRLRRFIMIRTGPLTLDVVASGLLFLTSNYSLEKWNDLVAIHKWKFGPYRNSRNAIDETKIARHWLLQYQTYKYFPHFLPALCFRLWRLLKQFWV